MWKIRRARFARNRQKSVRSLRDSVKGAPAESKRAFSLPESLSNRLRECRQSCTQSSVKQCLTANWLRSIITSGPLIVGKLHPYVGNFESELHSTFFINSLNLISAKLYPVSQPFRTLCVCGYLLDDAEITSLDLLLNYVFPYVVFSFKAHQARALRPDTGRYDRESPAR